MRYLIPLLLAAVAAAAPTTITGTITKSDGSLANGTVTIQYKHRCTMLSGQKYGPDTIIAVVTNGAFSQALQPTDTCIPSGTSYEVRYLVPGAAQHSKTYYWVVPTSGSAVTISSVEFEQAPIVGTYVAIGQLTGCTSAGSPYWNGTAMTCVSTLQNPMTTAGDMVYGASAGAGTRLPGSTAAAKRFLTQTGDGTNSAAPAWGSIVTGDLPASGVSPGSYGGATTVPSFTVDATGRITAAAGVTITGVTPGGAASGALDGNYPAPTLLGITTTNRIPFVNTPGAIADSPLVFVPATNSLTVPGRVSAGLAAASANDVVTRGSNALSDGVLPFALSGKLEPSPVIWDAGNGRFGFGVTPSYPYHFSHPTAATKVYLTPGAVQGSEPLLVARDATADRLSIYPSGQIGFFETNGKLKTQVQNGVNFASDQCARWFDADDIAVGSMAGQLCGGTAFFYQVGGSNIFTATSTQWTMGPGTAASAAFWNNGDGAKWWARKGDGSALIPIGAASPTGDNEVAVRGSGDWVNGDCVQLSSGKLATSGNPCGGDVSGGSNLTTSGRLVMVSAAGTVTEIAGVTWDASTQTLSVGDGTAIGALEARELAANGTNGFLLTVADALTNDTCLYIAPGAATPSAANWIMVSTGNTASRTVGSKTYTGCREVTFALLDASSVGLGSIPTTVASQAQAEAGTDNATLMTPLRTAQALAALASGGGSAAVADARYVRFDEEFLGTGTTSGSIGGYGWSLGSIGGTLTGAKQASSYPNMGVIRFTTTSTSGQGGILFLGGSSDPVWGQLGTHTNSLWNAIIVFRLGQTTDVHVRYGGWSAINTATGTNGFGIRYNSASDTNFMMVSTSGATDTTFDLGVAADTSYHTLNIYSDGTTSAKVYMKLDNGTARTICSSGCDITATPSTSALFPGAIITTLAAATKFHEMDKFAFDYTVSASANDRNP